jgi:hypothetical protein
MLRRALFALAAASSVALGGGLASPAALASPSEGEGEVASLRPTADVVREVDRLMAGAWKAAKVEPRPLASDAEWLRRLSLDVTGSVPDEDQVRAFLASTAPNKRAHAIREALASDGYARSMALRWSYLLVGRDYLFRSLQYNQLQRAMERRDGMMSGGADAPDGYDGPVPPLVEWFEAKLAANTRWDEVTRDLMAARGSVDENKAGHWALRYLKDGKAEELAGTAMRVFQGLQIQCAQCHDHPYTAWTQQDFYGTAAFFARTTLRREPLPASEMAGDDPKKKNKKGPYVVFERDSGQIRIPAPAGETGRLVLPKFLTGEVVRPGGGVDRRAELGRLMTAPTNPYFAKAMVNRVWSFFFGRGIVNPVDDLETTDYPHPEVLDLLVADFKASGHDMRRLCELILSTRAYQLTSAGPEEGREPELALFARSALRSLSAEQLFASVLSATGAEDVKTRDPRARARLERFKFNVLRKFIQTFGDDEAEEVVEDGTIPQALLLLNGQLTNDAIRPRPEHPVYERLFKMKSHDERIETIYLRVLGRQPEPAERQALREVLGGDDARTAAAQAQLYADIYWALLNSSEFVLNH